MVNIRQRDVKFGYWNRLRHVPVLCLGFYISTIGTGYQRRFSRSGFLLQKALSLLRAEES